MAKPKPPITANQVTLLRLLLLPIGGYLIYGTLAEKWTAVVFMTLLGLTDMLDGWLARRYGSTELGRLMDPIADKIFIIVCFMPFIDLHDPGSTRSWLAPWQVALLLSREFVVTALRSAYERRHIAPRTTLLAKIKAWAQMAGVGVLFLIRLLPERPLLIVLSAGTALPLVLCAIVYLARRKLWRGALIFFGWELIPLVPLWLFGPEAAVQALVLAVIAVTWISGWDYIAPIFPLLARRQLDRGDWTRILGCLPIPVLLIWAHATAAGPAWALMLVMSLEMAVGGLDNLLCHHSAQTPARIWGLRIGLISLLTLGAIRHVAPSTPLVYAALTVSLIGTALEFWRGRRYYLEEPVEGSGLASE